MLLMCVFMVSVNVCVSQTIGSTAYSMRIKKTGLCGPSNVVTTNGSVVVHKTTPFYSGYINLSRDFLVDKVIIKMEKCGAGFYPCEHFMTLKFDKNLEEFIFAQNQFCSPIYDVMTPKPKFPLFQKAVYTVINATYDFNAMLKQIPELPEHTWKIQDEYFEKDSDEVMCFGIEFSLLKYTVRPRKYDK